MHQAIIVENLGKCFRLRHAKRPKTFMEAVLSGFKHMRPSERFWALRDVSFNLMPGEMLGILGHNGAGKSTLLRLIGGVGAPDTGRIVVNGRIGALLDLGAGFHQDLSGRENIMIAGLVAGLTKRELSKKFASIVEFSELENFIDNPLRTYSSGMKARLGFSIATHASPDVLLVDEYLFVGDIRFQQKCLSRIQELKAGGCAILLVAQGPNQIRDYCNTAIWLKDGQIANYGPADIVSQEYRRYMNSQATAQKQLGPSMETFVENSPLVISNVNLLPGSTMNSGEALSIEIKYWNPEMLEDAVFSVRICKENGEICFSTNTQIIHEQMPSLRRQGHVNLNIRRLDLNSGKYFVNVGIHSHDWTKTYDYHMNTYGLDVSSDFQFKGSLNPPYTWEIPETSKFSSSLYR